MKKNVFLLSLLFLIINLPAYSQTLKIIKPIEQKNEYKNEIVQNQRAHQVVAKTFIDTEKLYPIQCEKRYDGSAKKTGIRAIAISPDGKYIATSSKRDNEDKTILMIFEIDSFTEIKKIETPRLFRSMLYSPDGQYIIAEDHVYDSKSLQNITILKNTDKGVGCIDISPDNTFIAVGGGYYNVGYVNIYDIQTWQILKTIKLESDPDSVDFSRNNKMLKINKEGRYVLFYSVGKWEELSQTAFKKHDPGYSFSPNFDYVAGSKGGYGFTALVKERMTGRELMTYNFSGSVKNTMFSSDGKLLLVWPYKNPLAIFDTSNWCKIQDIDSNNRIRNFNSRWFIASHQREIHALVYDECLYALDASYLEAYFLIRDIKSLGFMNQAKNYENKLQLIDQTFQKKLKELMTEKEKKIVALGDIKKDEFETDSEYHNRMSKRDSNIQIINQTFEDQRLALRRSTVRDRIELNEHKINEIEHLLDRAKKPIQGMTMHLHEYIADAMMFPLSIKENDVEIFYTTVRVPRSEAKEFKENFNSYILKGDMKLGISGIVELSSTTILVPNSGKTYSIGKIIYTGKNLSKLKH